MVAMMLTYQPFYIGGIKDVEQAKTNAYGAMATFIFTFIVAVLYLIVDVIRTVASGGRRNGASDVRRRSGVEYDGIARADPHILQQTTTNLDLPPSVEQAHFS
jgi:hypothetical protein